MGAITFRACYLARNLINHQLSGGIMGFSRQWGRSAWLAASVSAIAILSACGGGGEGSSSQPISISIVNAKPSIKPGETFEIVATATTQNSGLTAMSWGVNAPTNSPSLNLSNVDCATTSKQDRTATNGSKSSVWTCKVTGRADAAFAAATNYDFTINAVDDRSATQARSTSLNVAAGGTGSGGGTVTPVMINQSSVLTTVTERANVTLTAEAVLTGNETATYTWAQTAGATINFVQSGGTISFVAPSTAISATFDFRVTAAVGARRGTADYRVVVNPANSAFTLTAVDPLRVAPANSAVTLTANVAGAEQQAGISFAWTQTGGPSVQFVTSNNILQFITPSVQTASLRFRVTATRERATGTADFVVNVDGSGNTLILTQDQAIRQVASRAPVQLQAVSNITSSDVTYAWRQVSGPTVTSIATSNRLDFTAPVVNTPTRLEFEVTGTLRNATSRARYFVDVAPQDQIVVSLDNPLISAQSNGNVSAFASVSGNGNETVTYAFSQVTEVGVPAVTLQANGPRVDFVAPTVTTQTRLRFNVTATTGTTRRTATASFSVLVDPLPALTLVQQQAIQTVAGGANVQLQAEGSISNGVTYTFAQTGGPRVTLVQSGSGPLASFRAPAATDVDQRLTFTLTGTVGVRTATTTFSVVVSRLTPIFLTTDRLLSVVRPGETVTYTSPAQQDPAAPIFIRYEQVSGPQALNIVANPSPNVTTGAVITTPRTVTGIEEYVVRIYAGRAAIVPGGANATSSLDVRIVVDPMLNLQVATAEPSQVSMTNTAVRLTAVASPTDTRTIFYRWRQVGGPSTTLSNSTSAIAGFNPTIPGEYVFEVVVDYEAIPQFGIGLDSARTSILVLMPAP